MLAVTDEEADEKQGKKSEEQEPLRPKTTARLGYSTRDSGLSALETESERLNRAAASRRAQLSGPTERLPKEEQAAIPYTPGLAFGALGDGATQYVVLPRHMAGSRLPEGTPRWRIELHGLAPGAAPVGLDIVGDTVLGRGKTGKHIPDLDLEEYQALDLGVSRRHALLRPTAHNLYIIDLGSTNSTKVNAISLGPGTARALAHNDTVTLGSRSFSIKVIEKPGDRKEP
jgi:hypothetical protein